MNVVEIATGLPTSHANGNQPLMIRRERMSPAIGVAIATLSSLTLWAMLLSAVRWVVAGLL